MAHNIRNVRVQYAKCPNSTGAQFGAPDPHWLLADWDAHDITHCWVAGKDSPTPVKVRGPLKSGMVSEEELRKRWTSKEPDPYDGQIRG